MTYRRNKFSVICLIAHGLLRVLSSLCGQYNLKIPDTLRVSGSQIYLKGGPDQ